MRSVWSGSVHVLVNALWGVDAKDVRSLVSVIYKFGSHFEVESIDLLVLDT